jgi:DNA recombination protein RmuC
MSLPLALLLIVVAFAAGFAVAWRWQAQQARTRMAVQEAERRLLDAQREQERQRTDKHTEEKLKLLEETRGNLKQEFENLANRIFEDKQRSFHQQSGQRLDSVLNPLREQLTNFHKKVEDVYDKESKERSSLIGEIRVLKELNQQISQDAINLTQALKGDNKAQGNWGEMVLESILEKSGLVKGREYETQVSLKDDDGSRRAPDVIVHLPEGKDIIIDSKMVLVDYNRYCSAKTDDDKQQALRAHTQAIKNHINGLSVKAYEHLEGVRSLDFVLLFIPIEAAFMLAVENDPEIFRSAFDKGIIVVSPTTLLATLRTVQSIWRYEKQNRNAERIASEAGKLFDQFVLVLESLSETGKYIEKAQLSYDETVKRLSSGRGNLVGRIENLEKLGAKTKKQIPSEMKEISDDYSEDALPEGKS